MNPILAFALAAPALGLAPDAAGTLRFNAPGNLLVSDQFNNRVIEIDPATNAIAFQFGSGNPTLCNPGESAVIAPNDAERLAQGLTLIPGTGTAACPDNRVLIVDRQGRIVWQYGQAGASGAGPNQLNTPVFAIQEPDGNILIVDQGNNRLVEIDLITRRVIWTYGPSSGPGALNAPNSAEVLRNGHILIADENNSRVLEITRAGAVVAQITAGLDIVAFASRLPLGDTLIADSGNNRIVDVDRAGGTVLTCPTNTDPGSNPTPNPTGAVRLANGNTIVADQFNDRVIVLDPQCNRLYQYGQTNVAGNGPNQLNAPYSAVVIGQYIGVTKPPGL